MALLSSAIILLVHNQEYILFVYHWLMSKVAL